MSHADYLDALNYVENIVFDGLISCYAISKELGVSKFPANLQDIVYHGQKAGKKYQVAIIDWAKEHQKRSRQTMQIDLNKYTYGGIDGGELDYIPVSYCYEYTEESMFVV